MRILVVGANGFIGSYITASLLKNNMEVVCAVRDANSTKRKFPNCQVIKCDFNLDIDPQKWVDRLKNIDMVINVAGLLVSDGKNKIENVHIHGPKALFDACVLAKVKRIIHISALGIDNEETTDYALTKKTADNYLQSLHIDWLILKPSLIYAGGAYGGTALFRALSALPFFIPLVGDGSQQFQPIYIDDLTDIILACIRKEGKTCRIIKLVGPEIVTIKDILIKFRSWLGLPSAIIIKIPLILIKIAAKFGDLLGIKALNSTSYQMMLQPNIADKNDLVSFTSIEPRTFEQGIINEPLTIQSLWHARLFFLKPLIKILLALFWIISGIIPIFISPEPALDFLNKLNLETISSKFIFYASCSTNIILGLILLASKRISIIATTQILLIVTYTIFLSVFAPNLWLEPLGSLVKNIPVVILTLVLMAIERDK